MIELFAIRDVLTPHVNYCVFNYIVVPYFGYDLDSLLNIEANNGNLPEVKYLLEIGAKIETQFVSDHLPVRLAAKNGHIDCVKYLVSVGSNTHQFDELAVRCAAENNQLNMVKYLVDTGADIKKLPEALHWASFAGHLSVVKYLVSIGVNIHEFEDLALRSAVYESHFEIVKFLISVGANINAVDVWGFKWALRWGLLKPFLYVHKLSNIHIYV